MIKYFYYERHYVGYKYITKNEKILYEKPATDKTGLNFIDDGDIFAWNVDIEKRIQYIGSLEPVLKKVYDKLLIEDRNNKLETL